jgi:hypothetical protein
LSLIISAMSHNFQNGQCTQCSMTNAIMEERGYPPCPLPPAGNVTVIIPSILHRCLEINPISWLTPHLTISFASFCNIAQTGGGQGALLCCSGAMLLLLCGVFVYLL